MENEIVESKKSDRGFTLVELLIVIVILGILATVTVFAVRGITDQGKASACKADQKTLQVALESYYAQNGSVTFPTEAQLVSAQLLRGESANFDIDGAGLVIPAPNVNGQPANPCAGMAAS